MIFENAAALSRDRTGSVCDYRNMADEQDWADMGERVKRARVAAGLSQVELADAVGLDRTMVAKVEAGRRRLDALELARVARRLGLPMRAIVESRPPVLSHRAVPLTEDSDTEVSRNTEHLDEVLSSWIADIRQLASLGVLELSPHLSYPDAVTSVEDARRAVVSAWRDDLITTSRAIELMHGQITLEDLPLRDDLDIAP